MDVVVALLFFLLPPQPSCDGEGAALAAAAAQAAAFDPSGAAARLETAALGGCGEAETASLYLRGLQAARDAYGQGGDVTSLLRVKNVIARLEARASSRTGSAEVARLVLLAAVSAAQSEREEMAVFLEHAVRTEAIHLQAGERGAPIHTAHEAAGDLWLQVHRYEQARLAYEAAVDYVGASPRLALSLARVSVRLEDMANACDEYRTVLGLWGQRADAPPEITEARDYLRRRVCRQRAVPRRPR